MSKIRLYGATSGYLELKAPAVSPDAEVEIPASFGPYGKVLQVVEAVKTTQFSMSGNTPTVATGLSVSITPSSASSRIFVSAFVHIGNNNGSGQTTFQIYADSSAVVYAPAVNATGGNAAKGISQSFLHDPATTSAVTYDVRIWSPNNVGTSYVNWSSTPAFTGGVNVLRSTLTAMEIGA